MCAHFKWRERKSQFMVDLNELVQKKVLLMFAFILYCGKERKRSQKWKKNIQMSSRNLTEHIFNEIQMENITFLLA